MNTTIKKIVSQNIEEILLNMLKNKQLHGYAIKQRIRKRYGVYLSPSTIYSTLYKLEKEGMVKSVWDIGNRPRKVYTITQLGIEKLTEITLNFKLFVRDILPAPAIASEN